MPMQHDELIHDWNVPEKQGPRIQFDDETLRDGLQSPSAPLENTATAEFFAISADRAQMAEADSVSEQEFEMMFVAGDMVE